MKQISYYFTSEDMTQYQSHINSIPDKNVDPSNIIFVVSNKKIKINIAGEDLTDTFWFDHTIESHGTASNQNFIKKHINPLRQSMAKESLCKLIRQNCKHEYSF